MDNKLVGNIISDLKELNTNVILLENNDGFLLRKDVQTALVLNGFVVCEGSQIQHRVAYELRDGDSILILLSRDRVSCLEDMESEAVRFELFLDNYVQGYHIPSIIDQSIGSLDNLYSSKQLVVLSKADTERIIRENETSSREDKHSDVNHDRMISEISEALISEDLDWTDVSMRLGELMSMTIGLPVYDEVKILIDKVNDKFQFYRESYYHQTKVANATKHPQNVCKILDYIDFKYKKDKVVLIVVDGMSIWQYHLLSKLIKGKKNDKTTNSWIPSITQLSRQAIFRGDHPDYNYKQGPISEEKLWLGYWTGKGIPKYKIRYCHTRVDLSSLSSIDRMAIVYKELDAKMHGNCDDYIDLKSLTENWIERSDIIETIAELLSNDFRIILTTDHGNVEAVGWRGLTSREKLGQKHKSGSRGERHLEYSEKWLYNEFIENNEDIQDSIVKEDQAIYFKNNQSFSRKERLVTHGGAHVLEVVIPFVEISNE